MAVRMTAAEREQAALELLETLTKMGDDSPSLDIGIVPLLRQVGYFRAEEQLVTLDESPVRLQAVDFTDTRPRKPILVFRVCDPGRERRIHWSANLAKALRYAPNGSIVAKDFHAEPHLFSCSVPASRVLAVVRGDEWIVDVEALSVTDHGAVSNVTGIRLADTKDQPVKAELLDMFGPDFIVLEMPEERRVINPNKIGRS